jgi:hypothetical protein
VFLVCLAKDGFDVGELALEDRRAAGRQLLCVEKGEEGVFLGVPDRYVVWATGRRRCSIAVWRARRTSRPGFASAVTAAAGDPCDRAQTSTSPDVTP